MNELMHTKHKKNRPSHFPDMTSLWHDTVRTMLLGTIENRGIDYVANVDCIRYGNRLVADSMAYDFDLGTDLWLNRTRWTILCRQYLDLGEVQRFVENAAAIGLGEGKRGVITSMATRNVAREARKHRWGPCMNNFSYRGVRLKEGALQPTLTLHSRVSYIAYIGGADLALCHVLARYIAKRIKVPVSEFRFEWAVDSLQLHAFKSLPLLYKHDYIKLFEDKSLRSEYPSLKVIGRWWDQIVSTTEAGIPLEEIKYGPLRRVTRRYREYIADEFLPSVPINSLSFEALLRK
jgi:hypothetical protein